LVVRGIGTRSSLRADFLPNAPGVLEHSAKIDVVADADSLVLRLTRSQYASDVPDTLAGLLVLSDPNDLPRSYDVVTPVVRQSQRTVATTASVASLALALLSGLLVNLMPCVFPLLGVKALSFVTETGSARDRAIRAGTYAAGSVLSCVALGTVLLLVGANDSAWGFQMQSPRFLGVIALVAFVAALNLLGVFEVPSLLPSGVAGRVNQLGSHAGAFAGGAVAILIGAPCTAPFFGATLAGALTGPPAVGLVTLGVFGAGAALPVAAFTLSPALVRRLPKPGRWMQTTKQVLAFPMLAAAAWLVWVAGIQSGSAGYGRLLGALCAVALAAWVLGRWGTVVASTTARRAALGVSASITIAAGAAVVSLRAVTGRVGETGRPSVDWRAYTDQRLDSLRAAGRAVVVDFTAEWCLTCKVNEFGPLSSPRVTERLRDGSVGLLRADLTVGDTALTRALHALGAASVPTYAVYPTDGGAPWLLPPLLTVGALTEALQRARASAPGGAVTSSPPNP
jgi:thiol:disulfide interchange protein DsbD